MSILTNTLGRYFAGRFVIAAMGVFASIFVLLVLVDYIEMVRKTSGLVSASAIAVAASSGVIFGLFTKDVTVSRIARFDLNRAAPPRWISSS